MAHHIQCMIVCHMPQYQLRKILDILHLLSCPKKSSVQLQVAIHIQVVTPETIMTPYNIQYNHQYLSPVFLHNIVQLQYCMVAILDDGTRILFPLL